MPAWLTALLPYLPGIIGALGGLFHGTQAAANKQSLADLNAAKAQQPAQK